MTGKYVPLGDHLRACAEQGRRQVDLSFGTIDRLVSGLPASAWRLRPWWANSSLVQAKVWRDAGWYVQSVDLQAKRVVFVTGRVGGSQGSRPRDESETGLRRSAGAETHRPVTEAAVPTLETVEATVRFTWQDAGVVTLAAGGKIAFPLLPDTAGLYRLTLTRDPNGGRPPDLHRRVRQPAPTRQQLPKPGTASADKRAREHTAPHALGGRCADAEGRFPTQPSGHPTPFIDLVPARLDERPVHTPQQRVLCDERTTGRAAPPGRQCVPHGLAAVGDMSAQGWPSDHDMATTTAARFVSRGNVPQVRRHFEISGHLPHLL